MNKLIMKEMYVPLNIFRKMVMRTGIVTPKVECAFLDAYAEYSSYKEELHALSNLFNARGWVGVENMKKIIDEYNPKKDLSLESTFQIGDV